jgi:putative salt-induced outer membrane protein
MPPHTSFRSRLIPAVFASVLLASLPAFAGGPGSETAPNDSQEKPAPLWSTSLSLSYVATSGNTNTRTLGTDWVFARKPSPWGLKGEVSYMQAKEEGVMTAQRSMAKIRGLRSLSKRWEAFVGAAGLSDRFSGIHRRYLVETGATFHALAGPEQHLSFDAGLTRTREEFTDGSRHNYLGGVFGGDYRWVFSKGTQFSQSLHYYPDFNTASNWRVESETSLQAAVNSHLALKAGFQFRYDNLPQPGFRKTDTTTTMSLVFQF